MSKLIHVCLFLMVSSNVSAQKQFHFGAPKERLFEISVRKSGPFLGVQRGKYTVMELGGETVWKQIRLKKPLTQAIHANFNYNFKHNVMGFDAGYWVRPHRFGLTYGGSLVHRTDFTHHKFGFAPAIGYKILMLHLRVGYVFIPRPLDFETNTLFISLRLGIINDRDVDFVWNGFNKKKK